MFNPDVCFFDVANVLHEGIQGFSIFLLSSPFNNTSFCLPYKPIRTIGLTTLRIGGQIGGNGRLTIYFTAIIIALKTKIRQ